MKRRSFFRSLAKAAAIVALAPQLAFRVRPELPTAGEPNPDWQEVPYRAHVLFAEWLGSSLDIPPPPYSPLRTIRPGDYAGEWSREVV